MTDPEPEEIDSGAPPTNNEDAVTDAGQTEPVNRDEQPPGQISAQDAGCACQENPTSNDGRIPTLLLLFVWWMSVRKTVRGRLSYFGRTFQGRWVSRHD